jgi:hypothetical protein
MVMRPQWVAASKGPAPRRLTAPEVRCRKPATDIIHVVLPAPLGPMRPSTA